MCKLVVVCDEGIHGQVVHGVRVCDVFTNLSASSDKVTMIYSDYERVRESAQRSAKWNDSTSVGEGAPDFSDTRAPL